MTIIGIELEEVFSFKTRKDLKGVRWGYPVRWGFPYASVTIAASKALFCWSKLFQDRYLLPIAAY